MTTATLDKERERWVAEMKALAERERAGWTTRVERRGLTRLGEWFFDEMAFSLQHGFRGTKWVYEAAEAPLINEIIVDVRDPKTQYVVIGRESWQTEDGREMCAVTVEEHHW